MVQVKTIGWAAGGLVAGYLAYRYVKTQYCKPRHMFASQIADVQEDVLAEECVQERIHDVECDWDDCVALDWTDSPTESVSEGEVHPNPVAQIPQEVEVPTQQITEGFIDVTPPLEAKATRVVPYLLRIPYAKAVLDECKCKFGTPTPTEANTKAVWLYANRIMERHGVRPTHRIRDLPYIVALTFQPTVEEMTAGMVKGAMAELVHDRYEEYLSRLDRWISRLKRSFGW